MLLPGTGQLFLGARRRGLVLLGLTALLVVALLVVVEHAQLDSNRPQARRRCARTLHRTREGRLRKKEVYEGGEEWIGRGS